MSLSFPISSGFDPYHSLVAGKNINLKSWIWPRRSGYTSQGTARTGTWAHLALGFQHWGTERWRFIRKIQRIASVLQSYLLPGAVDPCGFKLYPSRTQFSNLVPRYHRRQTPMVRRYTRLSHVFHILTGDLGTLHAAMADPDKELLSHHDSRPL